jgi:hypothetical protein
MSNNPSAASRIRPVLFRLGVLSLLGFAILNGLMIWHFRRTISEGYTDFASFYTAGRIVSNGQAARLYDPPLQWQIQQQFAGNVTIRRGPLPFVRPPFEALLFVPLSQLTYPVAFVVWLVFKLVLLLMVPLLLPFSATGRQSGAYALRALLCLAFFPVGLDLFEGQDSILLLLVFAIVLRLLLRGADLPAGAVLALGLFKFHIIIPLFLVLALQKRFKTVVGFLATAAALLVLSVTMVHWSGVLDYGRYLWRLNQTSALGMATPVNMPNVRGFVTMLIGPLRPVAHWLLLGVVVFGVGLAAASWRLNDRRSMLPAFSFSIVVILVTSYYSYGYDLTLLLVPLLLLGESLFSRQESNWRRGLFLAASALLLFTPLFWVLVLKVNQASWVVLMLVAFGVPIFTVGRPRRSDSRDYR